MRFLPLYVAVAAPLLLCAQNLPEQSVLIEYSLPLMLSEEAMQEANPSWDQARMFTPLYPPEAQRYSEAFWAHLEKMREVKNYHGLRGQPIQGALGTLSANDALSKLRNSEFELRNGVYLSKGNQVESVRYGKSGISGNMPYALNADRFYVSNDTVFTENLETGTMVPVTVTTKWSWEENIDHAGFIESWSFDSDKGIFQKEPLFLAVDYTESDRFSGEERVANFFKFRAGKFSKKNVKEERLVRKNVEYEVLFNRGDRSMTRENDCADAMDVLREPDPIGFIEPGRRYNLLLNVFKSIQEGQAKVFDYNGFSTDTENFASISRDEFFNRMTQLDTSFTEDLETGQMVQVVVSIEQHLSDVVGFRFFEDWYMDYDHMSMYKRVNGIAFLVKKRDELTGDVIGVQPLASSYVKLNTRW